VSRLLEKHFDEIFTQKTDYQMLNLALKRLYENSESYYPGTNLRLIYKLVSDLNPPGQVF
jgi:hypothetical protein